MYNIYMIASFDCKFKTNPQNIEKILKHFGLCKIQSSLYEVDLNNNERQKVSENISRIIRENDNVLIIPLCQICYSKKQTCGRKIRFKEAVHGVLDENSNRCINKSVHKKDNQLVIYEKDKTFIQ